MVCLISAVVIVCISSELFSVDLVVAGEGIGVGWGREEEKQSPRGLSDGGRKVESGRLVTSAPGGCCFGALQVGGCVGEAAHWHMDEERGK